VIKSDYEDWGASVPHGVEAHFYSECDSTNKVAANYIRLGLPSPLWIIAGTQSGGRGRRGRTWVSEPGNLYASLVFKPTLHPKDLSALPYVVALAVRDTLIEFGLPPIEVTCKWPNDILVNGRKLSGILIESSAKSVSELEYVIVGIGINLLHSPEETAFEATSLRAQLGQEIAVIDAVQTLASKMKNRLEAWTVADFEPIRDEWMSCAWGLGQIRRIYTATEAFDAKLIGLDDQGGLQVVQENGDKRLIVAADIFPADTIEHEES